MGKKRSTVKAANKTFITFMSFETLRLYTGIFKFELDHYLTNVARVKSMYWGLPILFINWSHDVSVTWYS